MTFDAFAVAFDVVNAGAVDTFAVSVSCDNVVRMHAID